MRKGTLPPLTSRFSFKKLVWIIFSLITKDRLSSLLFRYSYRLENSFGSFMCWFKIERLSNRNMFPFLIFKGMVSRLVGLELG